MKPGHSWGDGRFSNSITLENSSPSAIQMTIQPKVEGQEIAENSEMPSTTQYYDLSFRLSEDVKYYPKMVRQNPERFQNVLDRAYVIQSLGAVDLFSRQIAQARRIAHFDIGLAFEFLTEASTPVPDVARPLSVIREQIVDSVIRSDQVYESLIGPYRWRGSPFFRE